MALAVVAGDDDGFALAIVLPQVDDLDARTAQQVHAIVHTVVFAEHDTADARLDDEFAALNAGRCGDIECCPITAVVAAGYLGDGVGLGMEDVGLGPVSSLFLTHVFKACRRAVIAVTDDHFVLDQQGTHLAAFTIGIFCPDLRHAQVSGVEQQLFFLLSVHVLQFQSAKLVIFLPINASTIFFLKKKGIIFYIFYFSGVEVPIVDPRECKKV